MLDHIEELAFSLFDGSYLITLDLCNPDTIHEFPMLIEMEVQIVCEDDIVEGLLVACELFFMAMRVAPVKVAITNIFRFNIEYRHTVLSCGDIVWSTTIHPFGLVCDSELWK